jgi:hypothetical protein
MPHVSLPGTVSGGKGISKKYMYKKESKNPIYIQKEAKTPQYCISNISNIFASVEHDCTTPIKHPYKMLYQHKDKCRQDKKKVGELTCTLDK